MSVTRTLGLVALALAVALPLNPLAAQSSRIWGEVVARDGTVTSGYLRWDRNEAAWSDVLDGTRMISEEDRALFMAARDQDTEARDRSIEYAGYRITWDDTREELPTLSEVAIRFGHIDTLEPIGDDTLRVQTRSGGTFMLTGGSTDIGSDLRSLEVRPPGGNVLALEWEDIVEVRLSDAPADSRPDEVRLHGTVEDRDRNRWTGWISWDVDDAFESDLLIGESDDGDEEIAWGRVARVERLGFSAAEVELRDGSVLELRDSDDVDSGNGGILVSDPALGTIRISWNELGHAEFYPPAGTIDLRDAYDGGQPLFGSVEVEDGTILTGSVRWDADEGWGWEMLDGWVDDVEVDVEFGRIARIEKRGSTGVEVILRDGRTFELESSNDVNAENRGVFVEVESGEWRYVDWYDFIAMDLEGAMGRDGEGVR